MNLVILLLIAMGLVFLYSAIKDKNPAEVIKGAFTQ